MDELKTPIEKFSYSKMSTYESCPWRYKLQYVDKHFIDTPSISADFGTIVHYVEETIANDIHANGDEPVFMIDMDKYINLFINGDDECEGISKLKNRYINEFYEKDKSGLTFEDKANEYLNRGIYMLQDFLNANRNIKIVGAEIPFEVPYGDRIFHGFIDRLLLDEATGTYIIQDLKTWMSIDNHSLATPLQFVFYTQAIMDMYNVSIDNVKCEYVLPIIGQVHSAGTKGYMTRGKTKIDKLLMAITQQDFKPKPSPLCHWCCFSATYPDQPEEAKNLCPYHSNWTRESKDFSTNFVWAGLENHAIILEDFIKRVDQLIEPEPQAITGMIPAVEAGRYFLLRR